MNFEWMILDHQSGLGREIPASLARDEAFKPCQIQTWLCPSDQYTVYNSRWAGGHPWPVWTNQRPYWCRRCCGWWPPGYTHCSVCQMLVFPDTVTSVMSQVVTTFTMRMKTRQSRHPFQTIETTFLKYGGHILLFKINRNRNAFSAKDTAWIDLRQILSVHSKEHIQDIKIQ